MLRQFTSEDRSESDLDDLFAEWESDPLELLSVRDIGM